MEIFIFIRFFDVAARVGYMCQQKKLFSVGDREEYTTSDITFGNLVGCVPEWFEASFLRWS